MTAILSMLAFSLSCAAAAAPATRYQWKNVAVGGGGFAPNIIFSRAEKGLAYLRTDMGGAYRWDASGARWRPLQDDNPVSSYMGIESIAPDPRDPAIVYMAAGMGSWGEAAIMRSSDRGTSWSIRPVPFKMGGNEAGRGLGERLAIDPNLTSTLYFGSRHDGLQRSSDSGRSWSKVESFPHAGLGVPTRRGETNGGISFVLFDPRGGADGKATQTIYAAVADPGTRHLFRSRDGGRSWAAVEGGPTAEMLPVKGEIDRQGRLYIAYSSGIGPNGIARGAVWRFDSDTGRWTDITPDRATAGGYMGLSLDAQVPGRLVVSSVNRWIPGDDVWLSTDAGAHWRSLKERSRRDVSATPFLLWGENEADFGHWIAGLAIDPFDGGTIAYTTGATLYRTTDGRSVGPLLWTPWVDGIEQTAVITLVSPTAGAPIVSGFGDIAGFVHDRLDRSPTAMHLNPFLRNTNTLDYAGLAPTILVRSGTYNEVKPEGDATLAWSQDGGRNWRPLRLPPVRLGDAPPRREDLDGTVPISVSADGRLFATGGPVPLVSDDRGARWRAPAGLPPYGRIVADKADPALSYALDFTGRRLMVSADGARSFAPAAARGLPIEKMPPRPTNPETAWPLVASPGRSGDIWIALAGRLFHSTDRGASFTPASPAAMDVQTFGLGMAQPGSRCPALYATGKLGGQSGVWRSLDCGRDWSRINDDQHQWGLRFRAISGDPKIFGRVYLATDGRGILYGDPTQK